VQTTWSRRSRCRSTLGAPELALLAPGASLSGGATVDAAAAGDVERVDYYVDGVFYISQYQPPYVELGHAIRQRWPTPHVGRGGRRVQDKRSAEVDFAVANFSSSPRSSSRRRARMKPSRPVRIQVRPPTLTVSPARCSTSTASTGQRRGCTRAWSGSHSPSRTASTALDQSVDRNERGPPMSRCASRTRSHRPARPVGWCRNCRQLPAARAGRLQQDACGGAATQRRPVRRVGQHRELPCALRTMPSVWPSMSTSHRDAHLRDEVARQQFLPGLASPSRTCCGRATIAATRTAAP
jgi:hypothetical protein